MIRAIRAPLLFGVACAALALAAPAGAQDDGPTMVSENDSTPETSCTLNYSPNARRGRAWGETSPLAVDSAALHAGYRHDGGWVMEGGGADITVEGAGIHLNISHSRPSDDGNSTGEWVGHIRATPGSGTTVSSSNRASGDDRCNQAAGNPGAVNASPGYDQSMLDNMRGSATKTARACFLVERGDVRFGIQITCVMTHNPARDAARTAPGGSGGGRTGTSGVPR
ncbi:MAG: hypothetical protein IT285_00330 [Bdellovibrionales bacterium]|nr:hypothetical protein [Bdellovibrionales bacterium]